MKWISFLACTLITNLAFSADSGNEEISSTIQKHIQVSKSGIGSPGIISNSITSYGQEAAPLIPMLSSLLSEINTYNQADQLKSWTSLQSDKILISKMINNFTATY